MDRTGLTRSVIYRLLNAGTFPKPVHLYEGSRAIGWAETAIDEWVQARIECREVA
jgi:prophage regulatory protein